MPELIDRYALKNHLYLSQAEAFKRSEWYVAGAIQSFINLLDKQPTVVSEVRHGRWIYDETIGGMKHYYCSSCKECDPDNKCFADENQILWFSFCPKCGADMREEGAETVELKPCPFCGGKAELRQEDFDPRWMPTRNDPDSGGCPPYYVKCDDCGASTEYRYEYPDAVELWNRRADNG